MYLLQYQDCPVVRSYIPVDAGQACDVSSFLRCTPQSFCLIAGRAPRRAGSYCDIRVSISVHSSYA